MTGDASAEKQPNTAPPEKEQHAVRIQRFNSLFVDIENYNNQFSMGSILGGLIKTFRIKDPGKPKEASLSRMKGKDVQEMTASGINLIHKPILDAIGISIEPVSVVKNGTLFGTEEPISVGELRVNIGDKDKFLSFLKNIDDPSINPTLKLHLQKLSDILAKQICESYSLQTPSDEALQLLGSLNSIVGEYKRLNIEGTERLEVYLKHSKQGDLREYLTVEQGGLLSEPGKNFGPADWQKDATPEYLAYRWDNAIKILHMAQENPKARDLYHQLFSHLDMCLKTARDNLETLQYSNKDGLRKVLQEVKQKFG